MPSFQPSARILIIVALLGLGSGCATMKGWFGGSKEKPGEPAELVEIAGALQTKAAWTQKLGDGHRRLGLRTHPVIEGERAYVVDDAGRVKAVSLATGDVLWEQQAVASQTSLTGRVFFWRKKIIENGLTSTPAVGNGMVIVGGRNGEVVALDADSGAERWKATVSSEVLAAPLITPDRIIVRSNDGRVHALDPANGSRKWVFDRGLPSLTVRGSSAAVAGQGAVYVGYDDGSVIVLRLEDGARGWEQSVADPDGRTELDRMADIDGEMQVGLNELYAVSFHDRMMSISTANGRPLWTRDVGSHTGLAMLADRLLVSDKAGTVWAIDRSNGSALWKQDVFTNRWLTTPAVHGDFAVVGDIEGYLHWIRIATGEIAARVRLDKAAILATPQVSIDGMLVAQSVEGKVAAYPLPQ
ncbi:MAG TPA: outer membrane protein assembly factor BamB [Arenimonas sp.]|nr:outer membrane protein assembly factor BamB [Arenimonas sp.]